MKKQFLKFISLLLCFSLTIGNAVPVAAISVADDIAEDTIEDEYATEASTPAELPADAIEVDDDTFSLHNYYTLSDNNLIYYCQNVSDNTLLNYDSDSTDDEEFGNSESADVHAVICCSHTLSENGLIYCALSENAISTDDADFAAEQILDKHLAFSLEKLVKTLSDNSDVLETSDSVETPSDMTVVSSNGALSIVSDSNDVSAVSSGTNSESDNTAISVDTTYNAVDTFTCNCTCPCCQMLHGLPDVAEGDLASMPDALFFDNLMPVYSVSLNQVSANSLSANNVSANNIFGDSVSENYYGYDAPELPYANSDAAGETPGISLAAPIITSIGNALKGIAVIQYTSVPGATGYEISYCKTADFGKNTTVVKESKLTVFSFTHLSKGARFFRVRAYSDASGARVYSAYSIAKPFTITKGVKEVSVKKIKLASVKSCKILNKTTFVFSAKIKNRIAGSDDVYYLAKLNPYTNKVESFIGTCDKTPNVSFQFPVLDGNGNSLLYGKYALYVKVKGKYKPITKASLITNPAAAANYVAAFPKARSKKGLQGAISSGDLGVKHSLLNICVSDVIAEGTNGVPYVYNGKTYYFKSRPMVSAIRSCNQSGITVSGVFLLDYRADLAYLIPKGARRNGAANYYSWDTKTKASRETFEAMFSYLAELYSRENCHLDNWILGNEINSPKQWNYNGNLGYKSYLSCYTHAFRIMYYAVKSHYKNARCYISMDHTWHNNGNEMGARELMTNFNKFIKAENKNIKWNLAYHAYPAPLTEPDFWNNTYAGDNVDSKFITIKNISVVTKFVKKKFGSSCHIILSEQGFTSTRGEDIQAAAVAYAYYIAEFNKNIDSFIMRSDIDNYVESSQGLKMGLCDITGRPKQAYDVFKYMDTPSYASHTKNALKTLRVSSWKQIVPGFNGGRLKKM